MAPPIPALDLLRLRRFTWAALLGYLVLIFYGSLYPFSAWEPPIDSLFGFLKLEKPKYLSMTDITINVMVYIPLGLMLTGLMRRSMGPLVAAISATVLGASLSFAMETLQMFLPDRVSSLPDLATNAFGTGLGAVSAWLLHPRSSTGRHLVNWRARHFQNGALIDASFFILMLCLLAELSPLIPSMQGTRTAVSVLPLWQAITDSPSVPWGEAVIYALKIAAFGLFVSLLALPGKGTLRTFAILLILALAIKAIGASVLASIPPSAWRLSLRAAVGLALGMALLYPALRLRPAARGLLAAAALLAAFVLQELAPGQELKVPGAFNWVPFVGQMYGFTGILDIIASPAIMLMLGALANLFTPRHRRIPVLWVGTVAIFALAFALEFLQRSLPGRTADITDVLLFVGGWLIPWLWRPQHSVRTDATDTASHRTARRWRSRTVAAAITLGAVALGLPLVNKVVELPLNEKHMYRLPTPEQSPPALLPGFRHGHPRLPAPTPDEIRLLAANGEDSLKQREIRAARGDIESMVFMARARPGSVDLALLHKKVMALRFVHRGHDEARPLALAYDWLYDQWSEPQRAALHDKLAEGCDYIIDIIRANRLSPYNVYLYNAPLQGLMAMSLVFYGDDPRAEGCMRFTNDMWKNRVLPVWRQVMGKHGGWHEGGEYIGVGMGQAIYQLPALWRSATGEDLFSTEPGIRGFLDFVVYRTRPDGFHFAWGDGRYYDRPLNDQIPLAQEFRHAAAYTLAKPDRSLTPRAWPWGPFNDFSLHDEQAASRLPLSKYFDGLGLVVARSDWSPDATYVTFKAGDNYWSHSHLDQGAFSIYKGGALAIDSGFYGPEYGSDHHMNYTYQTIAHNTITVTDPDDTIVARQKKGTREIANDGGQRRVGSGWGVEPAPLDVDEWRAKAEIYHTGTMERVTVQDGITIAVADVTPAYTNQYSGSGTFSHRTRRVERFWRIFTYDPVDDVIVIFDQIRSTNPAFTKRWLLHSIEQPEILADGFRLNISADTRMGHAGGQLRAHVLLPEAARISALGGPGREFEVDGRNFDERGQIQRLAKMRKEIEPGAWRVEVTPAQATESDLFLTVLLPTLANQPPQHRVRLLQEGARRGVEIRGPRRLARYWFTPGENTAAISATPASLASR